MSGGGPRSEGPRSLLGQSTQRKGASFPRAVETTEPLEAKRLQAF
jgi:hypothetical protein